MASTYEPISSITLATSSTITFSNIPQTYTDLVLSTVVISGGSIYPTLRFNNDDSANYSVNLLVGDGTSPQIGYDRNYTSMEMMYDAARSYAPASVEWNIFNYASSTYKTVLGRVSNDCSGNVNPGTVSRGVAMWKSTAAITTITFKPDGGASFAAGTIATLYGIKAA